MIGVAVVHDACIGCQTLACDACVHMHRYWFPDADGCKQDWVGVLGFIPGPSEPKCMDAYLQPLVDEAMRLATTGAHECHHCWPRYHVWKPQLAAAHSMLDAVTCAAADRHTGYAKPACSSGGACRRWHKCSVGFISSGPKHGRFVAGCAISFSVCVALCVCPIQLGQHHSAWQVLPTAVGLANHQDCCLTADATQVSPRARPSRTRSSSVLGMLTHLPVPS